MNKPESTTAVRGAMDDNNAFLDELKRYHEIQNWLYREARLLDEERFGDWLALLAPEIHYWLPLRENRFRKDRRPAPTPENSASVFNDDYDALVLRVKRFNTGLVWCEDPPPRTNRMVSNIEVEPADNGCVAVFSNLSLMRSRRQDEEVTFNARRRDLLRRIDGSWRLARRHIFVTHHVFLDENVSVFF